VGSVPELDDFDDCILQSAADCWVLRPGSVNTAECVQPGLHALELALMELVLLGDGDTGIVDLALCLECPLQLAEDAIDERIAGVVFNALGTEGDCKPKLTTPARVDVDSGLWLGWRHRWPRDDGVDGRGGGEIVARL
jgi:hypothetical protein